jgi:4-hydroxymandelate oxidase
VPAEITLSNVEELAAEKLDPSWYGFYAGGAGAERTLRENVAAFARWRLRQRVLVGVERVDTNARVLGHDLSLPLVVAPIACQRPAHKDGEEGMARAAAAVGAGFCLSTFASASPADVAGAAPHGVRFLQLYVFRDRGLSDELVAQALEAGFTAILLTVDLPVVGMRDRELERAFVLPEDLHTVRVARASGSGTDGLALVDPTIDWAYLDRLCSSLGVPVVVKGVLEAEDARRAAACGAGGVVVSNHGARQLDGARATIDALPEVVDAVGDRLEVLVDGGVRRGADLLVALALGARAVLVGRQPVWGLAAGGERGARRVLELLREELEITMQLTGCRSLADASRAILVAR